jgi:predicted metal-dependent enzyme (double-stranded beta helix superfamily)
MTRPAHPGDLDTDQLRALTRTLREQPELWRHRVRHQPDRRTYELLLHNEQVMAWLICWMDDHDTGFHDHDLSAGAVTVVEGTIREERLRIGEPALSRTFDAGETFDFTASDIHRVSHAGGDPAVTLHVYSPPLWRMGAYVVEPSGTLRRHSVSYAEELRPLDAAA